MVVSDIIPFLIWHLAN